MKSFITPRRGLAFFMAMVLVVIGAADFLCNHLLLPQERLSISSETYGVLVMKWYAAGVVTGLVLMFLFVESWVWNNWRSWNKFCCDHHERVYRSAMGLKR